MAASELNKLSSPLAQLELHNEQLQARADAGRTAVHARLQAALHDAAATLRGVHAALPVHRQLASVRRAGLGLFECMRELTGTLSLAPDDGTSGQGDGDSPEGKRSEELVGEDASAAAQAAAADAEVSKARARRAAEREATLAQLDWTAACAVRFDASHSLCRLLALVQSDCARLLESLLHAALTVTGLVAAFAL